MGRKLLAVPLFIIFFLSTAYVYYFYHSEIAELAVSLGLLWFIPLVMALIFMISIGISFVTGLPLLRKRKQNNYERVNVSPKIDIKALILGLLTGLAIILPVVIFLSWIYIYIYSN
jgi:hypothetical protein